MQKFSSLLLALIACAGTIFADGTKIGDLYYNLNADNKTAEVTYQYKVSTNYSDLIAIDIPESVKYNSVTYSVTSIGGRAFELCSGLTSITIPNSVTSIGEHAFSWCSGLTSVTIGNSVTSIGDAAFYMCSGLTSITIPNSVTSIGEWAFADCSGLTSITIPNSVTSIGEWAFYYCTGLTSIVVASGNTTYDSRDNCNAIIKTSSNTLIAGCQNTIIPNSVTSIGNRAFAGCSGLTSVTIPSNVTSIGEEAFANCTGLTSVTNYATTPQTIKDMAVFSGVNQSSCTLYVPEGSINLYKAAEVWKYFTNIQAIDETQSIGEVTNHQLPITNKIIKHGHLIINKNGKAFNALGTEIK